MSAYHEAITGQREYRGSGPEARAVASLLDVVEELAMGLAHGDTPGEEWADVVADVFKQHREELRVAPA